jgi:zinc D-Ala-D-Ala carboxypeptidase
MKLSTHFSVEEVTDSETARARGIANEPDRAAVASLTLVCLRVEELRARAGVPLRVSSGFRSPALDRAVGGSGKGQHTLGEALDLVADSLTSTDLARLVAEISRERGAPLFDQVIGYAETNHLHVSNRVLEPNRGQMLWCKSKSGRVYVPWSPTAP